MGISPGVCLCPLTHILLKKKKFIFHLFLAARALCCGTWASQMVAHGLSSCGGQASLVATRELRCLTVYGILVP